jgi:hypothetical protein
MWFDVVVNGDEVTSAPLEIDTNCGWRFVFSRTRGRAGK